MPRDFNVEQVIDLPRDYARVVPQPYLPAPVDPVLDVLLRGRAKVAAGWCQGLAAADATGEQTTVAHATNFCSFGGLIAGIADQIGCNTMRSIHDPLFAQAMDYLDSAVPPLSKCFGFISYNDKPGRTQAEVVAMWDRAIAKRRADLAPPVSFFARIRRAIAARKVS